MAATSPRTHPVGRLRRRSAEVLVAVVAALAVMVGVSADVFLDDEPAAAAAAVSSAARWPG